MNKKNFFLVLRILTGSLLYAVGFNVFVVPFGLFSGGAIGAAQLICIPVARALRLNAEQLISIVYILLNIPLFWIAWHDIGKSFLYKTILGVVSLALFLRLIPTTTAQIEDELVSVLLGGLLSGFGIGQILTTGGSAGGVDSGRGMLHICQLTPTKGRRHKLLPWVRPSPRRCRESAGHNCPEQPARRRLRPDSGSASDPD